MKQELHSVTDPSAENANDCRLLDQAEYSVGNTEMTGRLLLLRSEPNDESCQISLLSDGGTSLVIGFDSLEIGKRVFSLIVQNSVSLYHVADILEELEISAQITSNII